MRRDNPETQAIKRLMFAVLADAVRCFQTYADAQSHAGRRIFGVSPPSAHTQRREFTLGARRAGGQASTAAISSAASSP